MVRQRLVFVVVLPEGEHGYSYLGADPNGPLVPGPELPEGVDPGVIYDADKAPPEAARLVVLAGTTPAEDTHIQRRAHEVAGGLKDYLEIQSAVETQRAVLRRDALDGVGGEYLFEEKAGEAPAAAQKRRAAEEQAHAQKLFTWITEHAGLRKGAVDELAMRWEKIHRVARMSVLLVDAPELYRPFEALAIDDEVRWMYLFDAYDRARAAYRLGKARPSAG